MSVDTRYELADRYRATSDKAYLTGTQALVRALLLQRWRDQQAGLHTAGFVSGYRGSPLGNVDDALWKARAELDAQDIRFEPGLNEDLAAAAVLGSQQANLLPDPRYDGVFAMWYGKSPGVDRSCDALKHGNHAGTSPRGGALILAGDDHGAKSSTIAHQSEYALMSCGIPVLYPSNVQEHLDYAIYGWAMSRRAGCWVSLKCVTDVVESAGAVDTHIDRVQIIEPADDKPAAGRWVSFSATAQGMERDLYLDRLPAAQRFARANRIDRLVFGSPRPRLGIVTAGKVYGDVRQALNDLGIDEAEAQRIGLAVYKVGMTWPLEPDGLREFATGAEALLVVEEKRPLLEEQIAAILYPLPDRPALAGKLDRDGRPLLPTTGEINADKAADAIARWLGRPVPTQARAIVPLQSLALVRKPAFCSGCPHNSSTVVPEDSLALGGIGCHGMAAWMPERHTLGLAHMGAEGANWIGASAFTDVPHMFQNLGDGTYAHSGSLAIRAAVVAGVNITYKILVNGAVAMTGGQAVEGYEVLAGESLVEDIVRQLDGERVARIVVVTEDPDRYRHSKFPGSVSVRGRDDLDHVQRELRDIPGVTAIVYEQACAAELRRERRRGTADDPDRRVVINELVCEGCGDCGVQSNCIAVEPVETEFGRKRRINQDSCNKDESCLRGYCPSFAVLTNARLKKPKIDTSHEIGPALERISEPPVRSAGDGYSVLIAGIGGTGVVTAGSLLGTAAFLEGVECRSLDVTGLAQKNGPVSSHLRMAAGGRQVHGSRIQPASADVVIGCDLVVTSSPEILGLLRPGSTEVVANRSVAPTADFAVHPDLDFSPGPMESAIMSSVGAERTSFVDADSIALSLLGDSLAGNIVLLGYALQSGLLPVSRAALERAITLNGTKVEQNLRALAIGRLAAADPAALRGPVVSDAPAPAPATLTEVVDRRAEFLVGYQSKRLASRYRALVDRAAQRERQVAGARGELADAIARYYFKLLSYKDEYEVARLWTDPGFRKTLDEQFEPGYRIHYDLAPPDMHLPADPITGRVKKILFGPWLGLAFRLLAMLKVVRGTRLDYFGRTKHRRLERRLIGEYEELVDEVLSGLTPDNYEVAVELARIPELIRGYSSVKEEHLDRAQATQAGLLDRFRASSATSGRLDGIAP